MKSIAVKVQSLTPVCLLILILSLTTLGLFSIYADATPKSIFTSEELEWLKENPVIKVGPDPNYAPVEFYEDGSFQGLSIEYLRWISETYDIQFNYVYYDTWAQIMDALRNGDIMLQSGIIRTPERSEYLSFTEHYSDMPSVVMIRKNFPETLTEENLFNFKVGVIDDFAVEEYIREKYNPKELYEQKDVHEGLSALSTGQIDAMILDLGQTSYYVEKMGIPNLKISNEVKIDFAIQLSFATQKDNQILVSIMNKALNSMPSDVRQSFSSKWLAIGHYTSIDYRLVSIVSSILAIVLIMLAIVSFWFITLRKKDRELAILNGNLEDLNQELEAQIQALADAQGQLIESEKINALSRLAIGIAHEINTPLGTGISMTSFINTIAVDAKTQMLKEEELRAFCDQLDLSSELALSALQRASKIIEDFKLVANFQQDATEQYINLSDEILHLATQLSNRENMHCQLHLNLQPNIYSKVSLNSLVQIISALLENSYIHAYHKSEGSVELTLSQHEEMITFVYRDSGVGMCDDVLNKIYEPFYSTKRGAELRMGLGLYNVFNLVNYILKGQIVVTSKENEGTTVTIQFPVK